MDESDDALIEDCGILPSRLSSIIIKGLVIDEDTKQTLRTTEALQAMLRIALEQVALHIWHM